MPPKGSRASPRPDADQSSCINLADDPNEKHDVASANPEKVAELRKLYEAYARQAVPPKSAPRAPGFKSPRVWGEPD